MQSRRRVLITGSAGGMGQACARLFGATQDLVLTDVDATRLEALAGDLREEGYTVLATHAGDLGDEALLADMMGALGTGSPVTLIHTAGLSPAQADARTIMTVNLVATERLLRGMEPILSLGSVAIVVASMAGHMAAPPRDISALLDDPLAAGFLDRTMAAIDDMGTGGAAGAAGLSYTLSKWAVIRLVERHSVAWARRGARIVSISPGVILTPMGRRELAETPGTRQFAEATPAGRPGRATDIAMAARFLASDEASFITGCDLRVDGGGVAFMRQRGG
ncbi:SDR family oxidoreductase [Nitrospirillum iridis]|uniref:NAD(P)-dependent dehydrogenase (Short-subunit alcohol dehydrogenase family) n=1 Tax=Nitrospirillum iridis TaxID=765888 RepID=A0A7X0B2M6_9PROT|nr:SDR family oxidoreductase [Nitrospirillum iridis]MBB6253281.1 NAD(P)-dependent dehydrogenase (short-subunit alcohol dehydrogenase family) [Nitrospirillum iridis]